LELVLHTNGGVDAGERLVLQTLEDLPPEMEGLIGKRLLGMQRWARWERNGHEHLVG
jgi:hypothetical protein